MNTMDKMFTKGRKLFGQLRLNVCKRHSLHIASEGLLSKAREVDSVCFGAFMASVMQLFKIHVLTKETYEQRKKNGENGEIVLVSSLA